MDLLGIDDSDQLSVSYRDWVQEALSKDGRVREGK